MIDLRTETILTLAEAASRLPKRRAGKKPHVATLYRWASRGLRGVKLEMLQVGGTTCTSVEALQRFFDALTRARSPAGTADQCRTAERTDHSAAVARLARALTTSRPN